MEPAEWDRIFDLFHAAREKSGRDRVTLLDSVCGEDTPIRKAVEELLKQDESADGFLSEPLFGFSAGALRRSPIVSGQHFGRYTIGSLVGRGGMGEVWSARDTDLDRPVALKFLSSEALTILDPDQITREAKAASALNHPNIVTIHEVVHSESALAIVMELVEGAPLRQLTGKPLPTTELLLIGAQIGDALAAAHGSAIVHGDIKPENIVLRPDGYVKVLDFGLARKITPETSAVAGSLGLGTLRYMSPEQARGEALTTASDIFSYGLVLYELATGRHAYPAGSPVDAAQAILTRAPPPFSSASVPAPVTSLVRSMLAEETAARPSAQTVARVLKELQSGKEPPIPASVKWVIAATLLVAALVVVWRWKQARNTVEVPSFRQITTLVPENRATAAAISPDGKLAAYANVDGIFVRPLNSGITRSLPGPPDFTVDRLTWFADKRRLVASGFSTSTHVPRIWMISSDDASPRLIRSQAREATPSPDGKYIAYVTVDRSAIEVVRVDGEGQRRVVAGLANDTFPLVFWSADGRRIVFQRRHYAPQHYRSAHGVFDRFYEHSYESVELASGKRTVRIPQIGIGSAVPLPDGRILFLRYTAPFTESADELWEVQTDLATGAFIGAPHKIAHPVEQDETHIYSLSATADGDRIMVLKRSNQNAVFVGDFDESVPRILGIRRLTFDERTGYPHAWTADSGSVIFESISNGTWDLFKQRIDKRTPETLVATPAMEVMPHLAPDGRWVMYSAAAKIERRTYKLMRVPVEGGTPQEVPIRGPWDEFRCALGAGTRCVLRTIIGHEYYVFHDLDPLLGQGRELARTRWIPNVTEDWDISPDGTQVAIPNHNSREARIRVVELRADAALRREREVILPGLADLSGVVWSASGRGWFVSLDMTVGKQMLYVYPDGRFRPLGDISGWAVPSPNGRRISFVNVITATNAWLIERH